MFDGVLNTSLLFLQKSVLHLPHPPIPHPFKKEKKSKKEVLAHFLIQKTVFPKKKISKEKFFFGPLSILVLQINQEAKRPPSLKSVIHILQ